MIRETTVALRWVIPFLRVADTDLTEWVSPQGVRYTLRDVANPSARIGHGVLMRWLEAVVHKLADPALGLRAAAHCEVGDFAPLEYALRTSATLSEAIACGAHHMHLLHGAQEPHLLEAGALARWELRVTDGVPQPPAANDFALASALVVTRRYMGRSPGVLREVYLRHPVATDPAAYARLFHGARIVLGAPHNALVFSREQLDAPMSQAHASLRAAFELHLNELRESMCGPEPLEARLRALVIERLGAGDVTMGAIARKLAVSVATLRRRLSEDDKRYSDILDEVRCTLAEQYLAEDAIAIGQVATLLGFAHTQAFYKAFRRWYDGATPLEFRQRVRRLSGDLPTRSLVTAGSQASAVVGTTATAQRARAALKPARPRVACRTRSEPESLW
jgi:AraC-like DNA-binding protein